MNNLILSAPNDNKSIRGKELEIEEIMGDFKKGGRANDILDLDNNCQTIKF